MWDREDYNIFYPIKRVMFMGAGAGGAAGGAGSSGGLPDLPAGIDWGLLNAQLEAARNSSIPTEIPTVPSVIPQPPANDRTFNRVKEYSGGMSSPLVSVGRPLQSEQSKLAQGITGTDLSAQVNRNTVSAKMDEFRNDKGIDVAEFIKSEKKKGESNQTLAQELRAYGYDEDTVIQLMGLTVYTPHGGFGIPDPILGEIDDLVSSQAPAYSAYNNPNQSVDDMVANSEIRAAIYPAIAKAIYASHGFDWEASGGVAPTAWSRDDASYMKALGGFYLTPAMPYGGQGFSGSYNPNGTIATVSASAATDKSGNLNPGYLKRGDGTYIQINPTASNPDTNPNVANPSLIPGSPISPYAVLGGKTTVYNAETGVYVPIGKGVGVGLGSLNPSQLELVVGNKDKGIEGRGYGNLSAEQAALVLGKMNDFSEAGAKQGDKAYLLQEIDAVYRATEPITFAKIIDAKKAVVEGADNVAAALGNAGYLKAATQIGGQQQRDGSWTLPTVDQKSIDAMAMLALGTAPIPGAKVSYQEAFDIASKIKASREAENSQNKGIKGYTPSSEDIGTILSQIGYSEVANTLIGGQLDSKLAANPVQASGEPVTFVKWGQKGGQWQLLDSVTGEPKVSIRYDISSKMDNRNILIVDKSYLADKNDEIAGKWISFEDFSNAVAQGRVGNPADVHNAEVKGVKGALNAKEYKDFQTLPDDIKSQFFNAKSPEEQQKVLQSALGILATGEISPTVVNLINNAAYIDKFANYYRNENGVVPLDKWGNVVDAINREREQYDTPQGRQWQIDKAEWEATHPNERFPYAPPLDDSVTFKDSPIYLASLESSRKQAIEAGRPIVGVSPTSFITYSQSGANSLDNFKMDLTGVSGTRYVFGTIKNVKGQDVPVVTVDYVDNNGRQIKDSGRSYLYGTETYNTVVSYIGSNPDRVSQVVTQQPVPPTQQVTPPVIPPAGQITPPVVSENVTQPQALTYQKYKPISDVKANPDDPIITTVDKVVGDITRPKGVTVLVGSTSWCGPCKLQLAEGADLAKYMGKDNPDFAYYVVDVESPTYAELVSKLVAIDPSYKYNVGIIDSTPTIFRFKDGKFSSSSGLDITGELKYWVLEQSNIKPLGDEYKSGVSHPLMTTTEVGTDPSFYRGAVVYSNSIDRKTPLPVPNVIFEDKIGSSSSKIPLNPAVDPSLTLSLKGVYADPNKLVLVKLTQDKSRCGACGVQDDNTDILLRDITGYQNTYFTILSLDVNQNQYAEKLYMDAGAPGTPTTLVFVGGEYVGKHIGALSVEGFQKIFKDNNINVDIGNGNDGTKPIAFADKDISYFSASESPLKADYSKPIQVVKPSELTDKDNLLFANINGTAFGFEFDGNKYVVQQKDGKYDVCSGKGCIGSTATTFRQTLDEIHNGVYKPTDIKADLVWNDEQQMKGLYPVQIIQGNYSVDNVTPSTKPIQSILQPQGGFDLGKLLGDVSKDWFKPSPSVTLIKPTVVGTFKGTPTENMTNKVVIVGNLSPNILSGDNYKDFRTTVGINSPQDVMSYNTLKGIIDADKVENGGTGKLMFFVARSAETWCAPCKESMGPSLRTMAKGNVDDNIRYIYLSADSDQNGADEFARYYGLPTRGVPTYGIVQNGKAVLSGIGAVDVINKVNDYVKGYYSTRGTVLSENISLPNPPVVLPSPISAPETIVSNQDTSQRVIANTSITDIKYGTLKDMGVRDVLGIHREGVLKQNPDSLGLLVTTVNKDAHLNTGTFMYFVQRPTLGDNGLIWASDDMGKTWIPVTTQNFDYNLNSLSVNSNGKGIMTCSGPSCNAHYADSATILKTIKDVGGWDKANTLAISKSPTTPSIMPPAPTTSQPSQKTVTFTALPTGTNPEPYIKAMVSTSQFIKWFGGDKDWQSKVDAIVSKNTKDGKVDYSKAYSDIVAEKVSLFPPTVQYVSKTTPTVQYPTIRPSEKTWQPADAEIAFKQKYTEVQDRLNTAIRGGEPLSPDDTEFIRIAESVAPGTQHKEPNALTIMQKYEDYKYAQTKPVSPSLPPLQQYFGLTPLWGQINIRPTNVDTEAEAREAKRIYDEALEVLPYTNEKALKAHYLKGQPATQSIPTIETPLYLDDQHKLALELVSTGFTSYNPSTRQTTIDYKSLANRMGIIQTQQVSDYEASQQYSHYLKEVEAKPNVIIPVPNVVQIRADIAKPLVDAALSKVSSKDPSITEQDKYYASLGNYYRGNDGKINYYSVYEKSQDSPYPITIKKEEEVIKATGYGTRPEVPLSEYYIPPEPKVTGAGVGVQLPTMVDLFLGKSQPEQWIGKYEMKPTPIPQGLKPSNIMVTVQLTKDKDSQISINSDIYNSLSQEERNKVDELGLTSVYIINANGQLLKKGLFNGNVEKAFIRSGEEFQNILKRDYYTEGGDNKWILSDDFNKLSPTAQQIYLQRGYDAMMAERESAYQSLINAGYGYTITDKQGKEIEVIDIPRVLRTNNPEYEKYINLLYSSESISETLAPPKESPASPPQIVKPQNIYEHIIAGWQELVSPSLKRQFAEATWGGDKDSKALYFKGLTNYLENQKVVSPNDAQNARAFIDAYVVSGDNLKYFDRQVSDGKMSQIEADTLKKASIADSKIVDWLGQMRDAIPKIDINIYQTDPVTGEKVRQSGINWGGLKWYDTSNKVWRPIPYGYADKLEWNPDGTYVTSLVELPEGTQRTDFVSTPVKLNDGRVVYNSIPVFSEKYLPWQPEEADTISGILSEKKIETVKAIRGAAPITTPFVAGVSALVDIGGIVPLMMREEGLKFVIGVGEAFGKTGAERTKSLVKSGERGMGVGQGMATFFVEMPYRMAKDPWYEVPYSITMFKPQAIKGVGQEVVDLATGKVRNKAFAVETSIGMANFDPRKMSFEAVRQAVEAVQTELQRMDTDDPTVLTHPSSVIKRINQDTGVSYIKSAVNKLFPNWIMSAGLELPETNPESWRQQARRAASNTKAEALTNDKHLVIKGGSGNINDPFAWWLSQQAAFGFGGRGKGEKPIINILIPSGKETVSLADLGARGREAQNALLWGNLDRAWELITQMRDDGTIGNKLVNVWKVQAGSKRPELETTAFKDNDQIIPVPKDMIPSWARKDGWDTAVITTRSKVQVQDPDTGEIRVRIGDEIEMPIWITKQMLRDGWKMPSRGELALANLLSFDVDIRKLISWDKEKRRNAEEGEYVTSNEQNQVKVLKVIQGDNSWLATNEKISPNGKIEAMERTFQPVGSIRGTKAEVSGMAKPGVQVSIIDSHGWIVLGHTCGKNPLNPVEPKNWFGTIGGALDREYKDDNGNPTFKASERASIVTEANVPKNHPLDEIYPVDIFRGMRKNHNIPGARNAATWIRDPNWHPDPLAGSLEKVDPKKYDPEMDADVLWDYVNNETHYWVARPDRSTVDYYVKSGPPPYVYPEFIDTTVANLTELKRQQPNAPIDIPRLKVAMTTLTEAPENIPVLGGNIVNLKRMRDKEYLSRVENNRTVNEDTMRAIANQRQLLCTNLAKAPIPLEISELVIRLFDQAIIARLDEYGSAIVPCRILPDVTRAITNFVEKAQRISKGKKNPDEAFTTEVQQMTDKVNRGDIGEIMAEPKPPKGYLYKVEVDMMAPTNAKLKIVDGVIFTDKQPVTIDSMINQPKTKQVLPTTFLKEVGKNPRADYMVNLTKLSSKELSKYRFYMNDKKDAGYGISPNGELVNLFNNGVSGQGALMVIDAILRGAKWENHYRWPNTKETDPMYVGQFGFVTTRVEPARNGRQTVYTEFALSERNLESIVNYAISYLGGRPVWADKAMEMFGNKGVGYEKIEVQEPIKAESTILTKEPLLKQETEIPQKEVESKKPTKEQLESELQARRDIGYRKGKSERAGVGFERQVETRVSENIPEVIPETVPKYEPIPEIKPTEYQPEYISTEEMATEYTPTEYPTKYKPTKYKPTEYRPTEYRPTEYRPSEYPPEYTPKYYPPYSPPPPYPPPYYPPIVPPKKVIPPPPILEKFKNKKGEYEGLIAWKQGWVYKVLFPNYTQTDILNTRKPVEGVEYHTGLRSAYDSIIRRGGYIPPIIKRKMGIYDIEISTMKDQRKPELRYRREKSKVYKGKKRVAQMPQTRLLRF